MYNKTTGMVDNQTERQTGSQPINENYFVLLIEMRYRIELRVER